MMQDIWNRLDSWLEGKELGDFANGADERDIKKLERRFGEVPQELKDCLAIHNGQKEDVPILFDGVDSFVLLSAEQMIDSEEQAEQFLKIWRSMDGEEETEFPEKRAPIFKFPTGYMFMDLSNGELHTVSLESDYYTYSSLSAYLDLIADCLEAGRYRIGDFGVLQNTTVDVIWTELRNNKTFISNFRPPYSELPELRHRFQDFLNTHFDGLLTVDVNEHFDTTYRKCHNGQIEDKGIFNIDGMDYSMVSLEDSMALYEKGFKERAEGMLPVFINKETRTAILMDIAEPGENSSYLHKWQKDKPLEDLPFDYLDILLGALGN